VHIPNAILIIVLVVSLFTDLKERKILNAVTVPAAIVGLCYNCATGGLAGVKFALSGLLVGMGILLIPFLMGGIGAGDVKLLGVVGAVKGPAFVVNAGICSAVAGGILVLVLLVCRGSLLEVLRNTAYGLATLGGSFLTNGSMTGGSFPYGVAIFVGTMFTLVTGWSLWLL